MRRAVIASAAVIAVAMLAGCAPAAPAPAPAPASTGFVVGGDRPATVSIPPGYDPARPAPLLMLLPGYGSTAQQLEDWTYLGQAAAERGWLVIAPEGTVDADGLPFWNAGTPGCCNLYGSTVDDSAYLSGLITEAEAGASVDPTRVFIFGHSNGGFMAYRMACDHADQIAAIISLAGITIPESICHPSQPVHVLQVHGTDDASILYDGEESDASAPEMVAIWAAHDGCDPVSDESAPSLDLDVLLEGDETHQLRYDQGCDPGGSATLWTIDGGEHQPIPSQSFRGLLLDFFAAHAREK